jgi:hypothetical protein
VLRLLASRVWGDQIISQQRLESSRSAISIPYGSFTLPNSKTGLISLSARNLAIGSAIGSDMEVLLEVLGSFGSKPRHMLSLYKS